jgi:hypothetical protein
MASFGDEAYLFRPRNGLTAFARTSLLSGATVLGALSAREASKAAAGYVRQTSTPAIPERPLGGQEGAGLVLTLRGKLTG